MISCPVCRDLVGNDHAFAAPGQRPCELEEERLAGLAALVIKASGLRGTKALSREELEAIHSSSEQLGELLRRAFFSGLEWCLQRFRYLKRKEELSLLSTEEISARYERIVEAIGRAIAADVNDEAGDSLYEPPPIDSYEHILDELLEERRLRAKVPAESTTSA